MTLPSYSPPPGYEEYARPVRRSTSATAVVGLVLAVLVSPVGLVVSLVALVRSAAGREQGRGLAVTGVVVGALGTLLWVLAVVAAVALGRAVWQAYQDAETRFEEPVQGSVHVQDGAADVVVDRCTGVLGAAATGTVTITNSTDEPATYVVGLLALDAGGQRAGALAASSELVAPGESVEVRAYGLLDQDTDVATCEVARAVRSPQ